MKVFMRLLGTYMKETERYSLALITELGGGTGGKEGGMREGKKKLRFHELPQKNKQGFNEESTSHRVPLWQLEATVRREPR